LLQRCGNALQEHLSGAPFPLEVALADSSTEFYFFLEVGCSEENTMWCSACRSAGHHMIYNSNNMQKNPPKPNFTRAKNALLKILLLKAIQDQTAPGLTPF
jgi:hypothetical protein